MDAVVVVVLLGRESGIFTMKEWHCLVLKGFPVMKIFEPFLKTNFGKNIV